MPPNKRKLKEAPSASGGKKAKGHAGQQDGETANHVNVMGDDEADRSDLATIGVETAQAPDVPDVVDTGRQPKIDEEECYNLSVRLDMVMDSIGASEDRRWKYWDNAIQYEILHYVEEVFIGSPNTSSSFYIFGSSCEGTTTPGLDSDRDSLVCDETAPVVERIEDARRHGKSLLMVTDNSTLSGYVKLQSVHHGVPQTTAERQTDPSKEMIDQDGRICIKHLLFHNGGRKCERNGPAITITALGQRQHTDYVYAFRYKKVPSVGNDWLHRERPCGWPSTEQLQTMESYGCFFVGVGHPKSVKKDIEWRISFSLQERTLMYSLNIYQHKCYILLKIIKNDILLKIIKNDIIQPKAKNSISSYHCKTCLFYTIENSTDIVWTRETLIHGTRKCLELLLRWVQKGHCPNYFIPNENMFDKLSPETLKRVEDVLKDILWNGNVFLFSLKCDNIGKVMNLIKNEQIFYHILNDCQHSDFSLYSYNIHTLYNSRTKFLRYMSKSNRPEECLLKTRFLLQYLQNKDRITEHSTRDVRMALDAIIPHVHLQMAQCVVSIMLTNRCTHEPQKLSRAFLQHFLSSLTCDLISSRLILATYCLQSDMLDVVEEILNYVTSLIPNSISICGCKLHIDTISKGQEYTPIPLDMNTPLAEFRSRYTTGCIVILPSQAKLVHQALRYEMYRSLYIECDPYIKLHYAWYEWIVVDSQVYMYFLRYILYSNTDRPALKQDSVNKLRKVVDADQNFRHRETAYNLLGWIYTQENRVPEAWWCFCRSLKIRPLHNAAKWHLAVMVNAHIN